MAVTRVTEKKILRIIDSSAYQFPICLIWLAPGGDYRHWVFSGEMSEQLRVTSEIRANNLVSASADRPYDIEYVHAFEKVLSREVIEAFDVLAPDVQDYYITDPDTSERVLISERNTLKSLAESPAISLLLNPLTWDTTVLGFPVGPSLMRVFINGDTFSWGDKGDGHYSLGFRIVKQPKQILRL